MSSSARYKESSDQRTTYSNTIPVLVDHHDAQKHTQSKEEQPVDIMLDSITYRHTERKQEDLRNNEEHCAKNDITNRPSVIECTEDEDKLRDDVDCGADDGPEDVHDPEGDGFQVVKACDTFECGNRNEEAHSKDNKAGYP